MTLYNSNQSLTLQRNTVPPPQSPSNASPYVQHAGQQDLSHQHQPLDSSTEQGSTTQQGHHLFTNSTPTLQELHTIIKAMRSNASPGPDGLNAGFYKSAWAWLSKDVHKLVSDFYASAALDQEITQTYLTLIPKKMQPILPQDFRPISLCNVIYRLIAKTLADRLKPYLPNFIDHGQSAFIKNRHISSNIIITQEIIHSFGLKTWNDRAFLLKIDLAKAFDRLN